MSENFWEDFFWRTLYSTHLNISTLVAMSLENKTTDAYFYCELVIKRAASLVPRRLHPSATMYNVPQSADRRAYGVGPSEANPTDYRPVWPCGDLAIVGP